MGVGGLSISNICSEFFLSLLTLSQILFPLLLLLQLIEASFKRSLCSFSFFILLLGPKDCAGTLGDSWISRERQVADVVTVSMFSKPFDFFTTCADCDPPSLHTPRWLLFALAAAAAVRSLDIRLLSWCVCVGSVLVTCNWSTVLLLVAGEL